MQSQMAAQGVLKHVERRATPRFPIRLPIRVHRSGVTSVHMTVNVSAGGLLLAPPIDDARPGEVVALDMDDVAHGVQATIVNTRTDGTGMQFVDGHQGEHIVVALAERAQRFP